MTLSRIVKQARDLDRKIIALLEERVRLNASLAADDLQGKVTLKKPQAETRNLVLEKAFLQDTFTGLFDQARALECPTVAFLGPEATFSHQAVTDFFGGGMELVPRESVMDVFASVADHTARFGVVPVENSVEGSVNVTLDLLRESPLQIFGEMTLPIVHNLIGCGSLERIQEVHSHPQILAQCRMWLRKNLPQATQIETRSSAAAVRKIQKSRRRAAIGTLLAARLYHLPVLARGVQDFKFNRTRFLVLSREAPRKGKVNKTSIVFLCDDKPGALVECLKIFKRFGINLTRIESRPSKRRNWEYTFFVDLMGHREDAQVQQALSRLEQRTIYVKVMGSYPALTPDSGTQ